MPFRFIVESTKAPGCPLVFIMSEQDLFGARYGHAMNKGKIDGFEKGVDDFKWYSEQGLWEYPRHVYESDGHIQLDIYGDPE